MIEVILSINANIDALKKHEQEIIQQMTSDDTSSEELVELAKHLRQVRRGRTQIESGVDAISQINQNQHKTSDVTQIVQKAIDHAKKEIENRSQSPFQDRYIYVGIDTPDSPRPMFPEGNPQNTDSQTVAETQDVTETKSLPTLNIEFNASKDPREHWDRISRYILNQLAETEHTSVRDLVDSVLSTEFLPKDIDEQEIRSAFRSRIRRLKDGQYVANAHKGQEYTLTKAGRLYIQMLAAKDEANDEEEKTDTNKTPTGGNPVGKLFQNNPTDFISLT